VLNYFLDNSSNLSVHLLLGQSVVGVPVLVWHPHQKVVVKIRRGRELRERDNRKPHVLRQSTRSALDNATIQNRIKVPQPIRAWSLFGVFLLSLPDRIVREVEVQRDEIVRLPCPNEVLKFSLVLLI